MRVKKMVVPAISVMLAVMQFTGCGMGTKEQLVDMLSSGEQIEIVMEIPEDSETIIGVPEEWAELSYLTDQEDLRKEIDNILGIISYGSSKNGVLYVNPETEEWEPNNTLEAVYKNKAYREKIEDADIIEEINKVVIDNYVDLDETSDSRLLQLAALNAYFNIFPADEDTKEFDGSAYLTREQFMSGVAKAHIQAPKRGRVGDNEYSAYVELVSDSAYLDMASKSLNEKNRSGLMTRAEAAYMIAKTYYADELASVDAGSKPDTYKDVKNAGNMAAEAETTGKDQYKAANLRYMIDNPSKGLDEELYKAMVVAYRHKILGNEENSRWDEPVTKAEALQALITVYESAGTTIKCQNGSNLVMDITNESISDVSALSSDIKYEINGKTYDISQLENAGTVKLVQLYNELPPMTYAEWQEEIAKIDSRKYEIYKNHLVRTGEQDENDPLNAISNEQLLWTIRMERAMQNRIADRQTMLDNNIILTEEEVDNSLEYLYYEGRLNDTEKVAYEDIAGLNKPKVTYKRPSSSSTVANNQNSGSTADNSGQNTPEQTMPNQTTNDGGSGKSLDEIAAEWSDFASRETPNSKTENTVPGSTLSMP